MRDGDHKGAGAARLRCGGNGEGGGAAGRHGNPGVAGEVAKRGHSLLTGRGAVLRGRINVERFGGPAREDDPDVAFVEAEGAGRSGPLRLRRKPGPTCPQTDPPPACTPNP